MFVQSDGLVAYAPITTLSLPEKEFLEELEISFQEAYAMKSSSSIFSVLICAAFVSLVSLLIYSTSDMRNWHAYWVLFSTTVATSMLAVLGAVYVRQRGI